MFMVLVACTHAQLPPNTGSGDPSAEQVALFFPQHDQTPQTGLPAGELTGRLVQTDGCLWLVASEGTQYLALWPADFGLHVADGPLQVRGRDAMRAALGAPVHVSGGEYEEKDLSTVQRLIQSEVPEVCRGLRYWLVGDLVP